MAKRKADALALLRRDKRAAFKLAEGVGKRRARKLLQEAHRDMTLRLREVESLRGPGRDSFTATQLRVVIKQIEQVLAQTKKTMRRQALELADEATAAASKGTVDYLERANRKFLGIHSPLSLDAARVMDRAAVGVRSSVLHRLVSDPKKPQRKGILDRYGENVVQKFEERMQLRLLAKQPWADVRNSLIAESEFLQGAPGSWAERILRTETMNAHNAATWETMRVANKEIEGTMVKILSATFDDRTGSDSYAVHGQIRLIGQAFESWFGLYQHPPNRPNDREVVVPHRVEWPIPPSLEWRSDGEVSARWTLEKRKGSPPPRPKMTTIERGRFGVG